MACSIWITCIFRNWPDDHEQLESNALCRRRQGWRQMHTVQSISQHPILCGAHAHTRPKQSTHPRASRSPATHARTRCGDADAYLFVFSAIILLDLQYNHPHSHTHKVSRCRNVSGKLVLADNCVCALCTMTCEHCPTATGVSECPIAQRAYANGCTCAAATMSGNNSLVHGMRFRITAHVPGAIAFHGRLAVRGFMTNWRS